MIQFNLLPDVKLEYVKAQRTKHTVIGASMIAAGSTFVIFLLLFLVVNVVQKKSISDLNGDIKEYSAELKRTPDINKMLTVQSQLAVLPGLHADKVAATRNFKFIAQLTPSDVKLTKYIVDYVEGTVAIEGTSPSLDKVNTLTDTLKFTTFKSGQDSGDRAFNGVVLSQFTRSDKDTTFTVTANYNPAIFDNGQEVTLSIPSTISTRSVTEQPTELFTPAPNPSGTN